MSKPALKLFMLRDDSGATVLGDDGQPLTFASKQAAKAERYNRGDGYFVTPGPDHHKFNTNTQGGK